MKNNNYPDMTFISVMILVIGAVIYSVWEPIQQEINKFLALPWGWIGAGTIISIVLIIGTIKTIEHHMWKKRQEKENIESHNKSITACRTLLATEIVWQHSETMEDKFKEIQKKLKYHPEECSKDVEKYLKKWKKKISERKKAEKEYQEEKKRQELAEEREQERERKRDKELEEELFLFKKKKKSAEALPVGKEYPYNVAQSAKYRMERYLDAIAEEKEIRNSAIEYYRENDLDTIPHLNSDEKKKIYAKVLKEIKEGKLEIKKKAQIEYVGKKLSRSFYRAQDLDDEMKRRAKAQGFEFVRGNELDGTICGGFYVLKKNSRESAKHFVMKHLFAELYDNMYVEHCIENKRVDVAFLLPDIKIGIEVETGANKEAHWVEKRPWLNKQFDKWIIVCSRDLRKKYDKMVDGKQSYCMTPKEAKTYIQAITPLEHR